MPIIPIRWSPRPLRAVTRTRLWRQIADRVFVVAVCASVVVLLRVSEAIDQLAPISTGTWK